eukprot:TRINITY_DN3144_c0_g1_i1.p1 TRINITY_DN3144_c0_g1~~TRINITY_DN3144_c0_g1_i1.p1  ORF type:complete len:193 (-),score=53.06 TRINITY_DN3144_c0_g1_i1:165-683(-)
MGYGGVAKGKAPTKSWTSPIQSWGKGAAQTQSWNKGAQSWSKGAPAQSWSKGAPAQSWSKGAPSFAKGGKGFGGGFGDGFGKGKGKRKTNPETTAWIGGLPENDASVERNKAMLEHMKQAGNCKFVKIGKSGCGSAGFTSAEEVQAAIDTLNGSDFQGYTIQVDYWTKPDAA